jgi:hypothetical protein
MQRQAFELCRTKCHPYRLPVACGPSFRGSGATNILKGGAAGKVVGKLLRDGLIGEVSVAFPAKMADYASLTRNLLMAGPARISGRIGSTKASPISSSCKIRWSRDWQIRWAMSW